MSSGEGYQKDREKALKQRSINDWRRILNMPEGRRVFFSLMQVCGHRLNAFVPGDPHQTSYNCAMRAVGNYIESFIREASPAFLEQMEQEYNAEIKQYQKQSDKEEDFV